MNALNASLHGSGRRDTPRVSAPCIPDVNELKKFTACDNSERLVMV